MMFVTFLRTKLSIKLQFPNYASISYFVISSIKICVSSSGSSSDIDNQILRILLFLDRPRNTALTVTPLKLSLNTNIELTCTADGMPSTRNYRFYVNGKLIGNKTDGKLTVNVSPSNCVNYTGEYKCVPESAIGDGEMETETREFDCEFSLYHLTT